MRRPKPILPDPDRYDGVDKAVYNVFRSNLLRKLEVDRLAFGSYYNCMWYAFARLKDQAATAMSPWMDQYAQNRAATGADLERMINQLDLMFRDRNRAEKAMEELRRLRQGNRPFGDVLADFNQLLMEAGGYSWTDDMKRTFIDGTLNTEMRTQLFSVVKEASFERYCQQLQMIADRIEAFRAQGAARAKWRGRNTQAMSRSRVAYVPAPPANPAPNVTNSGDAMDWEPSSATLARQRRRAKWVDEAELSRRRSEGRCLRCGASDHMIKGCQYLGAIPPQGREQKQPRASRAVGPLLEDNEVGKWALESADEASESEN
jgi:hypothetical protein